MMHFDDVYVLDLHGNSKKNERAPGGGKDENVFDIQQGTAILILVRRKHIKTCTVHRADLWGKRDCKYTWLMQNDVTTTLWSDITPTTSPWLFVKQNSTLVAEYQMGWSVADIFGRNGPPAPGFATQHDEFAISFTAGEAIEKVQKLLAMQSEREARQLFALCAQSQWSYIREKENYRISI